MYVWLIIWTVLCISERASGIDALPNVTVFIGKDAYFKWNYTSNFSLVEWYKGNADGDILMDLYGETLTKYVGYIDYIDKENSIGMILSSVRSDYSGKYTVKVYQGTDSTESSTYLSVLSDSIYREYIHLVINDASLDFDNGTLEPGTINIMITVDTQARISLSHQSSSQIDWQNGTFSNQSNFLVQNTEDGDILTLYAEFPNIQGYITTVFTISDTKSLEPWLIAVIVVVVLAACVILIVIIVLLLKKKKSTNTRQPAPMNYAIYR